MNQNITIQISAAGAGIVGILLLALLAYMIYRVNNKLEADKSHAEQMITQPFSESMPGPKPIPPVMPPSMPVVPVANPKIKPIRYAYDSSIFERFYSPVSGVVEKLLKKPGEEVQKNETVMVVNTGNTISEIRTSCSGILKELNCNEEEKIKKDDLIFVIM